MGPVPQPLRAASPRLPHYLAITCPFQVPGTRSQRLGKEWPNLCPPQQVSGVQRPWTLSSNRLGYTRPQGVMGVQYWPQPRFA